MGIGEDVRAVGRVAAGVIGAVEVKPGEDCAPVPDRLHEAAIAESPHPPGRGRQILNLAPHGQRTRAPGLQDDGVPVRVTPENIKYKAKERGFGSPPWDADLCSGMGNGLLYTERIIVYNMKTMTLSLRLSSDEVRSLDEAAEHDGLDRSALLKRLLRRGYADYRMETACDAYRRGEVSLSRAAEMAGVSLYDLLGHLPVAGAQMNLTAGDLRQELDS